jgi:hypothetical protein
MNYKMAYIIVHFQQPSSSIQHGFLRETGKCTDDSGATTIDMMQLQHWKKYEPEKFGERQKSALETVEQYLADGNKCACGGGECKYAQENINTRCDIGYYVAFNGNFCMEVEYRKMGFCYHCEKKDVSLGYSVDSIHSYGYCHECISTFVMNPYVMIKYNGKCYNLKKGFTRLRGYCNSCGKDSVQTFCYKYARHDHITCCHDCASKLQSNEINEFNVGEYYGMSFGSAVKEKAYYIWLETGCEDSKKNYYEARKYVVKVWGRNKYS